MWLKEIYCWYEKYESKYAIRYFFDQPANLNTSETIAKTVIRIFEILITMTFTRSKIDFKDDTRKSKLISRRSNFPSWKGGEVNKFPKFSLEESEFISKMYSSISISR